MRAGQSRLLEFDAGLRLVRAVVPCGSDIGAVTGLSWADDTVWARLESPAGPPRVVALDAVATGTTEALSLPSRLMTVTADDGTAIELVVTGDAAGPAPTLLEVYGGFGLADVPVFEPSVAAWCALGGLHVTARIRGGGGVGSAWHRAAQGAGKGRAVADTVDVARALVAAGLTRPDLLVLAGASHGGLVAASAALHAPGLVAGVACTAAPLDPHRLEEHPLASAWRDEFGCPTDDAVRAAMDDYSPLRRLEQCPAGAPLPRFLLTTFAEDARVDRGATDRFDAALRNRGAAVVRHHRSAMGHGRNARTDVHAFAASVLDFALDSTGAA
jgi:prolyl oligopeptidase PreP (S9A serine peptidase family)